MGKRFLPIVVAALTLAGCGGLTQGMAVSDRTPSGPASVSPASSASTVGSLLWSNEFNGSSLSNTAWSYSIGGGGFGNGELQRDTRSAVTVSDGQLHITASRQGSSYTSGSIQTLGKVSFKYGLVEARIKVPSGPGIWPAFWAQGTDTRSVGWPADGEADIMEILGNDLGVNHATLHTSSGADASQPWQGTSAERCGCQLSAGYHTYAMEWSPGKIRFMLDGRTYGVETRQSVQRAGGTWPFDASFFLLFDLAVGGRGDGAPTSATHFPAAMLVDWVRVYQLPAAGS